jgi:hypothetical protein
LSDSCNSDDSQEIADIGGCGDGWKIHIPRSGAHFVLYSTTVNTMAPFTV